LRLKLSLRISIKNKNSTPDKADVLPKTDTKFSIQSLAIS